MKNLKKFFAMFLALCMVMGLMSVTTYAELGDYEEPYALSAGNMRPTGVYVEPGATMYVEADDCNGTVVSAMAYLSSDLETPASAYSLGYGRQMVPGETDGTATLELATFGGAIFSVYNSGEEDITVYLTLGAGAPADTTGTMDDPKEILLQEGWFGISGMEETSLEEGNEGYYYYVTAPADGLLTVGVNAIDEEYNYIGWMYNVNNDTKGVYGDTHWSDDEEPVYYEELKVSEGDVVKIFGSTYDPENWLANPAGTLIVDVSFSPVGSYNCPEEIEIGELEFTLEEGSDGYYVKWIAKEAGSIIISASGENGWEFSVNGEMADGTYYYGDTYTSGDEVVVKSESVPVQPGDVITIFVNTLMDEETWTCPAGTVALDVEFITVAEEEEVTVTEDELTAVVEGSEVEGLDEEKSIFVSQTYGQNVLDIKALEATTLKDTLYTAMDLSLLVYDAEWDFSYLVEFEEDEKADITMAIGEVLAEAETVDVYVLGTDGELTKLTTCEVEEGKIALSIDTVGTYVFVDATVEEEPDTPDEPDVPDTPDVPQTGDVTSVGAFIALAIIALAVVVLTARKKTVQE